MRKHFIFPFLTAFTLALSFLQVAMAQNTSPFWSLAGNSNASTASKLGTTNSIPLRLTTNNSVRLYISPTNGNVGIGTTAPLQKLDVNGNINLAKGFGLYMENRRVLRVDSATMGVFLGNSAGIKNTGLSNTAIGSYALSALSSGSYNSAFGYAALNYNTTGYGNTSTGTYSLSFNTTGSNNTATGNGALYLNNAGSSNTATGTSALFNNTTGEQNAAFGQGAMATNTAGARNTAIGSEAMNESTGTENTAAGYRALLKNNNGHYNVAIGNYALAFNNSSQNNTAVGSYAGGRFFQGWNNTYIGSDADATIDNAYNTVALGHYAKVTAPNQVRIGNSSTTSIGGYTNWTNISDGRVKRNIQENVPGLAFINKLKPVTYNLDLDAADKIVEASPAKAKDGKFMERKFSQTEIAARAAKQKVLYTGFVAQDVEKAAKELNYDFSGVDAAKTEKDLYGLRYTDFITPLVKAVQELSKENSELKSRLEKIEAMISNNGSSIRSSQLSKMASIGNASLQQNAPNPFNQNTTISYYVPQGAGNAVINITDVNGRLIKTVTATSKGKGQLTIEGGQLSSGTYHYSLIVDGKPVDTKKMVLVK